MKDERDRLYDALKQTEGIAEEVAQAHGDGCIVHQMAEHVGSACHGLAHQIAPERPCTASGPVQVATQAYRDGWETIFGKRISPGQA